MRWIVTPLLAVCCVSGAVVRESRMGAAASERSCSITREAASFDASSEQAFVRFVASGLQSGDKLRIDWVAPDGAVSTSAAYEELPAAREMCFLSAMPIGGFGPASQPGVWKVRVSVNDRVVHEKTFQITGQARSLSAHVAQVTDRELVIDAAGALSETSVNIAQYKPGGGWQYIAPALADRMEGGRMVVAIPKLEPAEYLVILRNPDGTQSAPARFVISTGGGYQMPGVPGESWRISQGPYGSYSHWGRALHAFDIAPVQARYVAAMRGGLVYAFDLGLGQTPYQRIFGNYITVQQDDGTYAHYAHLKTGTFLVRTGEKVEAGQKLAEVGTSGYSFGRHVHVQVTQSFSISSQSIPFRFEERGTMVAKAAAKPEPAAARKPRWTGELCFAEWWSKVLDVPRGARELAVKLGWEDQSAGFDLYLVSPSGKTYLPESEQVRVREPEAGPWRVSVQAVKGEGEGMPFWVEPEVRRESK